MRAGASSLSRTSASGGTPARGGSSTTMSGVSFHSASSDSAERLTCCALARACSMLACRSRAAAGFFSDDGTNQLFHQEAVHLEEREMADAVAASVGLVVNEPRSEQLEAIVTGFVQQDCFHAGQRLAEYLRERRRRSVEALETGVDEQIGVRRIGEGFHFTQRRWCFALRYDVTQRCERCGEPWREDGTLVDRAERRRACLAITNSAPGSGRSRAELPPGAIAVAERW